MPPARHIFVVGNSGAGKTTLARALAEETGRSHLDLDSVAFVAKTPARRPIDESVSEVHTTLGDSLAVIEGCYADLVSALAKDDDHLIWLDVAVETCVAHAEGRPWEPHKWESQEAQDGFLPHLVAWIRQYPTDEGPTGRGAHAALFDGFPGTRERRE